MDTAAGSCPFTHAQHLPGDSTPLRPSPTIAAWREAGPAVPLAYHDGHQGWVVTGYDAARAILTDPRFSQLPHRMPVGPTPTPPGEPQHYDQAAHDSVAAANLLGLDGEDHQRMRRGLTPRFSVKQVRGREPWVRDRVAQQLDRLRALGPGTDLFTEYAQPIAAATHCLVIGVPDHLAEEFVELFVHGGTTQAKFDHIRAVFAWREQHPGEDVVSDLIGSDFTRVEAEGLVFQLMSAGRDSVAYLIATATTALLTHPDQAARLRADPSQVQPAIEEFMRTGAMFLTLFPRTATEDVDIEGVRVSAGQTVSVSPVGANRDPARWERADQFDTTRDAFGHLGFGHGPHGCVGQQLARLEIREAITQLLVGLPTLHLIEAEQLHPLPFANPVATYEAGAVIIGW